MVAIVAAVFSGLLLPIDLVEQLRRIEDGAQAGLGAGLRLAALNLPGALYEILPLIVILATLALFLGLARSSELVVIRASGRPALRAVMAPVAAAVALGLAALAVLNPVVAATQAAYERALDTSRGGIGSILSVSEEGVWLRQGDATGQTVIRAARASLGGTVLFDATFLAFGPGGAPVERIDARRAELSAGAWTLEDAKRWPLAGAPNPEAAAQAQPVATLPSTLTETQIRDGFGEPSAIPIFALPGFVARLEAAGFAARAHRAWLHRELSGPVMLAAMVLIGAAFTMRHARGGQSGRLVLLALLLGFGVFFLRSFAQTLGVNGQLPLALAAWAPPVAAILLALGIVLRLEDG
jgi:lipopolysaccharide export system permease protein